MGGRASRLAEQPSWIVIDDFPVALKNRKMVKALDDNYTFQLGGKVKFIKKTITNYYYKYKFEGGNKEVFEAFLVGIEERLHMRIHIFGYDRRSGELWIYSKEPMENLTFSAHCMLTCSQVIQSHVVLHVKFVKVMPYRNYASIMSVCGQIKEEPDS